MEINRKPCSGVSAGTVTIKYFEVTRLMQQIRFIGLLSKNLLKERMFDFDDLISVVNFKGIAIPVVLNDFKGIAIPVVPNDSKLYPKGLSNAKNVVVPSLDKIYVVQFRKGS